MLAATTTTSIRPPRATHSHAWRFIGDALPFVHWRAAAHLVEGGLCHLDRGLRGYEGPLRPLELNL